MKARKVTNTIFLNELPDMLGLELFRIVNGQPNANNSIKLIRRDAQRK